MDGVTITSNILNGVTVISSVAQNTTITSQLNTGGVISITQNRIVSVVSGTTTGGSIGKTDYIYLVLGATTYTQPTAVGNTNRYTIKNVGSATTVTVIFVGGQTGDGSSSLSLLPNDSVDLISNGSNWCII